MRAGRHAEHLLHVDRQVRRPRACRALASVPQQTRANLDANPVAQVLVVDPATLDEYVLDLRHVHTETEGPVFEAMRAELEAIASQTGMGDGFRLRGADIYHVVRCE